jgi:hypothetical protein
VQLRAAVVEFLLGLTAARMARRALEREVAAGDVHAVEPRHHALDHADHERAAGRELERIVAIVGTREIFGRELR